MTVQIVIQGFPLNVGCRSQGLQVPAMVPALIEDGAGVEVAMGYLPAITADKGGFGIRETIMSFQGSQPRGTWEGTGQWLMLVNQSEIRCSVRSSYNRRSDGHSNSGRSRGTGCIVRSRCNDNSGRGRGEDSRRTDDGRSPGTWNNGRSRGWPLMAVKVGVDT